MPRYTEEIQILAQEIRGRYFAKFFKILQDNPEITRREAYEMTEAAQENEMFSSYGSFRVQLYHFRRRKNGK
jgi:hypothetical protein